MRLMGGRAVDAEEGRVRIGLADENARGRDRPRTPASPGPSPALPDPAQPDPNPARPNPARPGPARPSQTRPSPTQPDPAQPNPARPGPARPDPAQPGPARPSPPRPGQARPDLAQPDPARPGPARPGQPGPADQASHREAPPPRSSHSRHWWPDAPLVIRPPCGTTLGLWLPWLVVALRQVRPPGAAAAARPGLSPLVNVP